MSVWEQEVLERLPGLVIDRLWFAGRDYVMKRSGLELAKRGDSISMKIWEGDATTIDIGDHQATLRYPEKRISFPLLSRFLHKVAFELFLGFHGGVKLGYRGDLRKMLGVAHMNSFTNVREYLNPFGRNELVRPLLMAPGTSRTSVEWSVNPDVPGVFLSIYGRGFWVVLGKNPLPELTTLGVMCHRDGQQSQIASSLAYLRKTWPDLGKGQPGAALAFLRPVGPASSEAGD